VLTTLPKNRGNLDPNSKFVHVRKAPAAVGVQAFSVGIIVGCAHIYPEIATSSQTADERNEGWLVNIDIDLATSNNAYNL